MYPPIAPSTSPSPGFVTDLETDFEADLEIDLDSDSLRTSTPGRSSPSPPPHAVRNAMTAIDATRMNTPR